MHDGARNSSTKPDGKYQRCQDALQLKLAASFIEAPAAPVNIGHAGQRHIGRERLAFWLLSTEGIVSGACPFSTQLSSTASPS